MRANVAAILTFQLLVLLLLGTGCTWVGPEMMHKDRFDYTTAVGDTWKEQVLLKIVRIRYSDWPTFVAVDQIVTVYTMEHRFVDARGAKKSLNLL